MSNSNSVVPFLFKLLKTLRLGRRRADVGVHGASHAAWREQVWQFEIVFSVAMSAEFGCTSMFWFLHGITIPALFTPMTGILVAELQV